MKYAPHCSKLCQAELGAGAQVLVLPHTLTLDSCFSFFGPWFPLCAMGEFARSILRSLIAP